MGKDVRQRLERRVREEQILNAAIELACQNGYASLRRDAIAEQAKCATGQINFIFHTMKQLNKAVMRETVKRLKKGERDEGLLRILAQGITAGETEATKAPSELKQEAIASLIN